MASSSILSANDSLLLFSGLSNPVLASKVGELLREPVQKIELGRFSDGEVNLKNLPTVRGRDCFVLQSVCPPVNENLVELFVLTDALYRAGARRVTAVIPYFGYARQDRRTDMNAPITARLVAKLVSGAGATHVMTMDLHSPQIQGFFDVPADELTATPFLAAHFARLKLKNPLVVSPDVGGLKRAKLFATFLGAPLAVLDKHRIRPGETETRVIGDVKGHTCILVDDMVDTGSTLAPASEALLKAGALAVYAAVTHGVLSGPAVARVGASDLKALVVTDSIPQVEKKKACRKLEVVSAAPILAAAIQAVHEDRSITKSLAELHSPKKR